MIRNTVTTYLEPLTWVLEKNIAITLPSKFALVCDGWYSGDSHYVAGFATYILRKTNAYQHKMIWFSSFEYDDKLSANEHNAFISFILNLYGKKFENLVAILGDKRSTNRSFAKSPNCNFIGCYSHKFNLEIKDFINAFDNIAEKVIDKFSILMKKLRRLIYASKLMEKANLKAELYVQTWWISMDEM